MELQEIKNDVSKRFIFINDLVHSEVGVYQVMDNQTFQAITLEGNYGNIYKFIDFDDRNYEIGILKI